METTMKKTTSPIVREYKIGDITYIVKAVVKDGAKEDAVTKVRRLIQNDLRAKKVTNSISKVITKESRPEKGRLLLFPDF